LCVVPDTVPAQSFCAEISLVPSHFVVLVGVAILRSQLFAGALIYTERKEINDF
jgi:hypothetical protein